MSAKPGRLRDVPGFDRAVAGAAEMCGELAKAVKRWEAS
jgi:hypothetical protein